MAASTVRNLIEKDQGGKSLPETSEIRTIICYYRYILLV
jgi:hypothetical protein